MRVWHPLPLRLQPGEHVGVQVDIDAFLRLRREPGGRPERPPSVTERGGVRPGVTAHSGRVGLASSLPAAPCALRVTRSVP